MKSLIRLILFAVVAIIAYNYFYGTPSEKAQSKEIVDEVADFSKKTFKSIGNLLKAEKEKFSNGKHREAMDDMKDLFAKLKKEASTKGAAIKEDMAALDEQRKQLEQDMEANAPEGNPEKQKKYQEEFEKLAEAAKILFEKMGNTPSEE